MLGKLLKYELRATGRQVLPLQSFYCQFMDSCYYLPSYLAFILQ